MRNALIAAALLVTSGPLIGQSAPAQLSGKGSPDDIAAGSYAIEPHHTQVTFNISHMGISPFTGTFSRASGTMTLDPENLAATKLDVTIPVASIRTTSDKLTEELKGADWFDATTYPEARFVAKSVVVKGPETATVTGKLTLHGQTHPIAIAARFFGAAPNPMSKKDSVGFVGRAVIKRSDFGIDKYVPLISDETVLTINAAFEKQ